MLDVEYAGSIPGHPKSNMDRIRLSPVRYRRTHQRPARRDARYFALGGTE